MEKNRCRAALAALCCVLAAPWPASAGEFSVNPICLELGSAARSGAFSVRNEGKEPLSFQLEAREWVQDADGKDQYLDTRELIFFPKIMTLAPGQEGVVRVGARTHLVPAEKTYRLFIEELPDAGKKPGAAGAQVTFLIRFGAPIFITPLQPEDGLELERAGLVGGQLSVSAKNTGNRHQVIQGIHLKGLDGSGKEVYATTLADRYLLAGAVKSFQTAIPAGPCAQLATLSVEVKTDKLSAARTLAVTKSMCADK